jgi:hypothetical protein
VETSGSHGTAQAVQPARLHRPQSPQGPHFPRVAEPLHQRRNPGYTY